MVEDDIVFTRWSNIDDKVTMVMLPLHSFLFLFEGGVGAGWLASKIAAVVVDGAGGWST